MKKTIKITIKILLSILLALALFGCSTEQTVTEGNAEAVSVKEEQMVTDEAVATEEEQTASAETEASATEKTSAESCGLEESDAYEILCYGDSNTYGYDPNTGGRYPDELLWTTQLDEKLGENYKVLNEGKNGRTTAYDLPGAEDLNGLTAFQEYLSGHRTANMIVFMLGTNDLFISGITAEEITAGMESLILEIKELSGVSCGWDPELVIVVPPEINADMFEQVYGYRPEAQQEISRQLVTLYKELADKYGALYLDASQILEVSEIDAVHLTENGHRVMAESLYELISSAVGR